MNTDRTTETIVESWLAEGFAAQPDAELMLRNVRAGVAQTPQRRHRWWPFGRVAERPVPASERPPTRSLTAFSAFKFITAGVIVALFGGLLLVGIFTTRQGDDALPAAVTGSPAAVATREQIETPTTSVHTDILAGVSLTVEEAAPGVYRVVDDGVRNLASVEAMDIVAGYDGSIWLLRKAEFLRLGTDGSHEWPDVSFVHPDDPRPDLTLDVAPDGTMWVIPRWTNIRVLEPRRAPGLRSTDGEEWTFEPCPTGTQDACRGFTVAPDGEVWASWYEDGRWRLGHLGPTGWQPLDGYLPDSFRRLFFTDAGDLYGMRDGWDALFRYEEGGSFKSGPGGYSTPWEEVANSLIGPQVLGVGRDGTIWQGDNDALARFADGEWERVTSTDLLGIRFGFGADHAPSPHDHEFRVAPDGSLWASLSQEGASGDQPGECDGLARFDGQTLDRFLPGRCISMDIAADGSVWVLAGDETVWVLDEDEWILDHDQAWGLYVITPEAVPTMDAIDTTVATTTISDLLPGVTLTVEEVEPGVFRVVDDGVRDVKRVTTTAVGDDGSVWIDSANGIVELGRPGEHPGLVDGDGFLAFTEDGALWAISGDRPDDLHSFDGESWIPRFMRPDGIASVPDPWWPADYITGFAFHPDGTVWQVAEQSGPDAHTRVQHLGTDAWTTYDVRDKAAALGWCGICADGVPCPAADCEECWDLAITPDGTVWLGIPPRHASPISTPSGGLLRFDGADWQVVRPLGGDEDHGVSGLAVGHEGVLWAEFETGDLARFDGRAWEVFSNASARDPGLGRILTVDPDGNLWAGWDYDWFGWDYDSDDHIASDPRCDGVRRFDWSTWTTFLPGMCVSDIDIARDGAVWVTLPGDPSLDWIPGHGHGADLYVITPEAVAAAR